MTGPEKTTYVVLVETSQGTLMLSDDDGLIAGFETEQAALAMFEDGYNSKHRQSYEGSMSACVNWLLFRPKVVPITGVNDLLQRFFLSEKTQAVRLGSVAGFMTGLLCDRDVKAIWDAGVGPRLISQETFEPGHPGA